VKNQIRGILLWALGASLIIGFLPACAGETPELRMTAAQPVNPGTPTPLEPVLPTPEASATRSAASMTSQPSAGATLELALTSEALVTDRPTSPIGTSNPLPHDPYVLGLVEAARLDLATRLKLPVEQVQFVSFEAVVWPDASLGCPQPDMLYAQVQQEGYRITLATLEVSYPYHGGAKRGPFLCEIK